MPQTKIEGKFYPLTNGITTILRQAKLTAAEWRIWSYLVELDPFGDRYADFDYLSVISACECSKSSFYRAIAKFQELKIFDFQARGLSVRNLTGVSHFEKSEPKAESDETEADKTKTSSSSSKPNKPKPKPKPKTEPDAVVSNLGIESQNWENSLKNETLVPEMGKQSQNWENQELKPLSDIASNSPQTLHTKLDYPNQPDGGGQNKFQYEEINQSGQVSSKTEKAQSESKETKEKENHKHATKAVEKKEVPRDVVREKSKIPDDLKQKLEELEIPLDEEVINAIASHDISQAYGAIAHIEDTWETINNPRGVFLFQIPKQKIEQLGARLPEIGKQMREENQAIEEEMATEKYKQNAQEMFAKLREKLGKGGKK